MCLHLIGGAMGSRGKKLVNLALAQCSKLADNESVTNSDEVEMKDLDFGDFDSDDSLADSNYVPSSASSSEGELDIAGQSDSESDLLDAGSNSDIEAENAQGNASVCICYEFFYIYFDYSRR